MSSEPPENNSADLAHATVMASVVGQVGCLNILLIGIALGVGLLLDRALGTSGVFAAIFILASVPVALFFTMQVSLRAIKRVQEQAEQKKKKKPTDNNLIEDDEAL